jgi:hypothetical protein
MTLTEQWKKGELPDGFYYFKMLDGTIEIASEYRLIRYNLTKDADKIEVLAPVPSYDHFVELTEKVKENQQLKELLCKCREKLDWLNGGYVVWGGELTDFIEEIDEVLK